MRYGQEVISKHKLALLMFWNVSLMSCRKHSGYYFIMKTCLCENLILHVFAVTINEVHMSCRVLNMKRTAETFILLLLYPLYFDYYLLILVYWLNHNAQKKLLRISIIATKLFILFLNFYMLLIFFQSNSNKTLNINVCIVLTIYIW